MNVNDVKYPRAHLEAAMTARRTRHRRHIFKKLNDDAARAAPSMCEVHENVWAIDVERWQASKGAGHVFLDSLLYQRVLSSLKERFHALLAVFAKNSFAAAPRACAQALSNETSHYARVDTAIKPSTTSSSKCFRRAKYRGVACCAFAKCRKLFARAHTSRVAECVTR